MSQPVNSSDHYGVVKKINELVNGFNAYLRRDIYFKKLHPDSIIPTKAYEADAGMDLYAYEPTVIRPGETVKVKTGIACAIAEGGFLKVFDRSSLGSKGIIVTAGVIDAGYRNELLVCLHNLRQGNDDDTYVIQKGDKIAQMVLLPVYPVTIKEVEELPTSERGEKGFGSSGK